MLGRRYRQAGRGEQAHQVLESISPTQPQYAHAQMELAQLYVEEGKADDARRYHRQMRDKPGTSVSYWRIRDMPMKNAWRIEVERLSPTA